MDYFAMLTPHEKLVETVLHIGQAWTQGHVQSQSWNSLWATRNSRRTTGGSRWE